MKIVLLLASFLGLAACGIDGPPQQPTGGIETGDESRIGVVGTL